MHETDLNPTLPSSEPAEGLEASALRAHAWYGEPFLHAGEDPVAALAPGTARRAALDDAIAEMDAGRKTPSNRWRVRYGLMLGLERVLAAQGELRAFRTYQKQLAHRARPLAEQLHGFMWNRKQKYAVLLVEALDLERVPRPLDRVLAHVSRSARETSS